MKPKVIFENNDLLVLDKPSGMVVNLSDTTRGEKTVQEWVEEYLKVPRGERVPQVSRGEKEIESPRGTRDTLDPRDTFNARAGIVHRLDKETSGILLVGKTLDAFVNLQAQFKERKVQKTYVALAHGKIEPIEGGIDVAVGRLPWNRKRFGVIADGRESVTRYKVFSVFSSQLSNKGQSVFSQSVLTNRQQTNQNLKTENREPITEYYSLLELYPKTGRTHQIRVHLQYIHHPIFADPLYGGRKTSRNDRKLLPRVFLHASKISFYGPKTNELLTFESSLPDDLKQFLTQLSS